MEGIFSKILSMSLSASFVMIAVLLLRLLLKKAPKKYSYFLWLLVFFRLLCPITIESPFSLLPVKEDAIVYQSTEGNSALKVNSGLEGLDTFVTQSLYGGEKSVTGEGSAIGEASYEEEGKALEAVTETNGFWKGVRYQAGVLFGFADMIWLMGVIFFLMYGIIQMLLLKRKLRTAVLVENHSENGKECPVYESEYISTAFLLGGLRPRIYLPLGIGKERDYVIAHERMHKKRLDYIVKPICYLAVVLHWFHPLVWLSFSLMSKDMEMSCDEEVLKNAIEDIRAAYSKSLLNLSAKGSGLTIPLAFGETNTKERICHVLKYKKPSVWISIAGLVVILIAAVTLLTGSGNQGALPGEEKDSWESGSLGADQEEKSLYQRLSENRNPYIGDASANGQLIGLLPGMECYERKGMELQTTDMPYELKLLYEKAEPITVKQEQENAERMRKNALYFFATIENMDICTFVLSDGEESNETSYTRGEMEDSFGPLYEKSETAQGLQELSEAYKAHQEKMEGYLNSAGEQENMSTQVEALISEAILEHTKSPYAGEVHVEAHAILGGEEAVFEELIQSDNRMEFYILFKEGTFSNPLGENVTVEKLKENTEKYMLSGSGLLAKVTLSRKEDGTMSVAEFRSYYEKDMGEIFPEEYQQEVPSMEGAWEELEEELLNRAAEAMNR